MNTGAVIPAEILSRTDLPIYVKLVYGRMTVLLERHGFAGSDHGRAGEPMRHHAASGGEVVAVSGDAGTDPVSPLP